jgi:hypothetical protein
VVFWQGKKKKELVEDRVVFYLNVYSLYEYRYYGASEAVNLCRNVEKSTKCSELKSAQFFLENKISCGLTIVCASSFRPSQTENFYDRLLEERAMLL